MSQKAPARLRLLNSILEVLAGENDHAASMAAVLRLAREHFGASRAFVMEFSNTPAASRGGMEDLAEGVSSILPPPGAADDYTRWAALASDGKSISLSIETANQPNQQFLQDHGLRALLAAPLFSAGRLIGLVGLCDPAGDAADMELIAAIGLIVESEYQKHHALAEQQALNARYTALMETLPNGIGILNIKQGRIQSACVNDAYAAMLGDTPSAAAANFRRGPLHYVHEDDRNDFLQALQPLLAGKTARIQVSYRMKCADGSLRPVQEIFTALPSADQNMAVCIVSADMPDAGTAGQPAESRYRLALEAASLSVWDYDIQKRCIIRMPSGDGAGEPQIIHNVPDIFVEDGTLHPDHAQAYLDMYHRLQSGEPQVDGVFRMLNDDRSAYRYEHIRYISVPDGDRKPHMAVGISQDVTEKFAAQHNYARELQLQQMLVADMYATILLDVTNWQVMRFQCRDQRFSESLQGKDPDAIFQNAAASVASDEPVRERLSSLSRDYLHEMYRSGQHTFLLEYQRIMPGGEVHWIEEDARLLADPDSGHLMMFLQIKDVDSEKRRLDALSLAAETDSMTGFYNHDATMGRIRDFIAGDGYHGHHALFMIDIDNFKEVNDELGHSKGDETITKISTIIRVQFRNSDLLGRIGGDEFLVLMKNITNASLAHKKAAELIDALQFICTSGAQSVALSASVGVCMYDTPGLTLEMLYAGADAALYSAKNAGKNRCAISTDRGQESIVQERVQRHSYIAQSRASALENELRLAEERYRIAITCGSSLLWEVDIQTQAIRHSMEVAARFGQKNAIVPNVPDSLLEQEFVHPDSAIAVQRMFRDMFTGKDAGEYFLRCMLDGEYQWIKNRFRVLRNAKGVPYYAICISEPVPSIEAEMRHFEQEHQLASLAEGPLLATIRVNLSKDRVEYFSMSDTLHAGSAPLSCDELFALCAGMTADIPNADDFPEVISPTNLRSLFRDNRRYFFAQFARKDTNGEVRWTDCSVSVLSHPINGDLYAFLCMRDIDMRQRFEAALPTRAALDASTQLFTAEAAEALANAMLEDARGKPGICSLTTLKLVGFEQLRATKGLVYANELLASVARLCRLITDPNAIIGKLNESQIVFFHINSASPDIQQTRILQIRDRVHQALSSLYPNKPVELVFGFDTARLSDASYDALLRKALLACQSAAQWSDTPIARYTDPGGNGLDAALPEYGAGSAGRHTVLITDDSPSYLEMLRFLFEESYTVLEAENGADALVCMRTHPEISAVILDLLMPEMDGFQVLEAMQGDPALSRLPVIVVTSEDDPTSETQALDLGAADVISKPFYGQTMLRRVRNTIARSDAARIAEQNRAYELRFQQQANMLRLADYDELTGVYNKRAFCNHVREALDAHPQTRYVICRWDIDRFKVFNDVFGTQAGDTLLREIGSFLHECAVPGCIYGHLESDHFAICLPEDEVDNYAIVEKIERWFERYPVAFNFSPRFGLYTIDEPETEVSLMCDRALLALRSVKGSYSNKLAYYDGSLRNRLLDEQELIGSMQAAIDREEFVLYFQPQYNYDTGELVGAEALVRWNHPTRGMLAPGVFIPLFENNGFISTLDEYIWEHSCRTMRRWLDDADRLVPVSISVNISRLNIYNPNLCQTLKSLVEKYHLPPSYLKLEITESAYMETPEQLIEVGATLQGMGFTVEMDDFGSGYSSLNTLKDVPVDVLKLDMKFLSIGDNDSRGANILSSIVRMARWLQLPVIAEGVETKEQADYLNSIGCSFMQGYYFCRPVPDDEFETLLVNSKLGGARISVIENTNTGSATAFWDASAQTTLIFNQFVGGAATMEYRGGNLEALRINDRYIQALGTTRAAYFSTQTHILDHIQEDSRPLYVDMLERAIASGQSAECEVLSKPFSQDGKPFWIHNRAHVLASSGDSYLFYIATENISQLKELERGGRLRGYQDALVELFDEVFELDYQHGQLRIHASKFMDDTQVGRILPLEDFTTVWGAKSRIFPTDEAAVRALIAAEGERHGPLEYRLVLADGQECRISSVLTRIGERLYLLCNTVQKGSQEG